MAIYKMRATNKLIAGYIDWSQAVPVVVKADSATDAKRKALENLEPAVEGQQWFFKFDEIKIMEVQDGD